MIKMLYEPFQHWSSRGRVWIISDTHFDDPDCKLMDPDWPHAMQLVNRINSPIGKQDTLIHLGDVGDPQYMRHIHCRHKVLIKGNHDSGSANYEPWFDEIYSGPLMIAQKMLLSHEPIPGLPWCLNIHGHDHNNAEHYTEDCHYYNVACNVANYTPVNLGKIIKEGALSKIPDIHRMVIDNKTE